MIKKKKSVGNKQEAYLCRMAFKDVQSAVGSAGELNRGGQTTVSAAMKSLNLFYLHGCCPARGQLPSGILLCQQQHFSSPIHTNNLSWPQIKLCQSPRAEREIRMVCSPDISSGGSSIC